ncbi:alternative ribosome rescue aminoacyl-tRNA hydrolase ArfB [Halomonas piscis]|uniref:Alternative ribosome rescue aminoacyl-tRNA hydrolase ArfB n=1 Tax=Halomonas piscis TaxID=3031727 RepID=A0ABY9Z417_9GAMM|nr:alternative ribosome rescue aminoacyl-tRNA hydrolase ArfB [Halomonas piscis]WNK21064.1 alternative ribosome rescue aminoacyl-tRNA hydrolase ArfB [Halomonas piscis]
MLRISNNVTLADREIHIEQVRAQGPGGQNVNKVASAVHLRFDIHRSTLPTFYKERLLTLADQRITRDGVIVIKAQKHRTLERNREDALARLKALIKSAAVEQKKRRPTRPSRSARRRRLDNKTRRGQTKALRGRVKL